MKGVNGNWIRDVPGALQGDLSDDFRLGGIGEVDDDDRPRIRRRT